MYKEIDNSTGYSNSSTQLLDVDTSVNHGWVNFSSPITRSGMYVTCNHFVKKLISPADGLGRVLRGVCNGSG